MNQLSSLLPPFTLGLTIEDLEFARVYHNAAPDLQALLRNMAASRILSPAEIELLGRYHALSAERQQLVQDIVRELAQRPHAPPNAA